MEVLPDLVGLYCRSQLPQTLNAMNSATIKHQLSLPYVLLPASPTLAALHATRVRISNPLESASLDTTHCSKCGSYVLNGNCEVSLVRNKIRRSSKGQGHPPALRVVRRVCGACGFRDDIPADRGNAGLFPRTKKARPIEKRTQGTITEHSKRMVPAQETPGKAFESSSGLARSPSIASSSNLPSARPSPTPTPFASTSQPSLSAISKSRSKKKNRLQDMLSRNREKEERERQSKQGSGQGGLAAFLGGI